jgi:hypothetical protein
VRGSPELCYFPFGLLVLTFWVNADAATDLTAAGVRGLLNSFAAVDATRAEVCSFAGFFVDMIFSFYSSPDGHPNSPTCCHLKFPHPERGVMAG